MLVSNLTPPFNAQGNSSLSALSSSQPPLLLENIPSNVDPPDDDDEDEVFLDLSLCQAPSDSLGRVVTSSSLTMTPTKRTIKKGEDVGPPLSKPSSPIDALLYASPPPFLLPISNFASVEDEQIEVGGEMRERDETAFGSSNLISTSPSKEYDFGSWQLRSPPTLSYFHDDDAAIPVPMFDSLYDDDRLTAGNNAFDDFTTTVTDFTVNPQEVWHSASLSLLDYSGSAGNHNIITPPSLSNSEQSHDIPPPPPPPPILFQLPNDTSFGDYLDLSVDGDNNHDLDYGLNCSFNLPVPLAPSSTPAPPPQSLTTRNILEALTDDELRDFGYSSHWLREAQQEEEDDYYSSSRIDKKEKEKQQEEAEQMMEDQRRRAFVDLQRRLVHRSTHIETETTMSPSSTLLLSQASTPTTATTISHTTTATSSTTSSSTPSSSSSSSSAASPISPSQTTNTTTTTTIKASGDRARNACKHCHKRKTKCTEERPTCLHCQQVGAICEYPTEIRRRGKGKNNSTRETSSASTSSSSHIHRRSRTATTTTAPSLSSYRGQSVHSDDSYTPSSGHKRSKR